MHDDTPTEPSIEISGLSSDQRKELSVEFRNYIMKREEQPIPDCESDDAWYGGFAGGDPRCFTPDAEGTTPEEISSWIKACMVADNIQVGVPQEQPDSSYVQTEIGIAHVTYHPFGLGMNYSVPLDWKAYAIAAKLLVEDTVTVVEPLRFLTIDTVLSGEPDDLK